MTLNELASKEVIFRTNKTVVASKALISLIKDKPIRESLKKSIGMPIDKIAEFVAAYLLGHQLVDATGYDTRKGNKKVEIKWSFLNRSRSGSGHPKDNANLNNLLTKSCDLMVFVCDDQLPPNHKNYIRIFLYPVKIWKQYWTKDTTTMGFKRKKWYTEDKYRFTPSFKI
jgi:hypothetical protein